MNDKRNDFRRLRAEYDLSFRRWEEEVRGLELLTSQPDADSEAVERAQLRVDEAQNAYRENRNRLAQFLVSALGISSDRASSEPPSAVSENAVASGVGRLQQRIEAAREQRASDKEYARVRHLVR